MSGARRRRRDESDIVLLELVRLVSSEAWDAERCADTLVAKRYHVGALLRARARVLAALNRAPSRLAERAAATLEVALWRLEVRQAEANACRVVGFAALSGLAL